MRLALIFSCLLLAASCGPAPTGAAAPPAPAPSVQTVNPPPIVETAAAAPAAASSAKPAAGGAWIVDPAHSSIVVNGFMNKTQKPQSGTFDKWSAKINFDPNDLAHAKVAVTISTASFKTGNVFYDGALPDPDWLSEDKFPNATFASNAITSLGGGKYQAKGALTIKGAAFPVTLPFTLVINGASADMKGALPLDLDTLGMGKQNDPSREYAAKAVTVDVAVHATRG